MRGALLDVTGVESAEVDCSTGRAVCQVRPGTDPQDLVQAVELAGFDTSVLRSEPAAADQ